MLGVEGKYQADMFFVCQSPNLVAGSNITQHSNSCASQWTLKKKVDLNSNIRNKDTDIAYLVGPSQEVVKLIIPSYKTHN